MRKGKAATKTEEQKKARRVKRKKVAADIATITVLGGVCCGTVAGFAISVNADRARQHTAAIQAQATQTIRDNVDPGVLNLQSFNDRNLRFVFKDNADDGRKLIVSVQCGNGSGRQNTAQDLQCRVTGLKQVPSFG